MTASLSVEHALALIQSEKYGLLILGHTLTSDDCCRLAKAFRQLSPGGRVLEIASSLSMKPLNNPDAIVVGLDGPVALLAMIEKQIAAFGHGSH